MDERTVEDGCKDLTALVVRYLDGRPVVLDEDSDDICLVYEGDTAPAAAEWLFAERSFVRCSPSEAMAEVVMVTMPEPADPAELEAFLQIAAQVSNITWGYVRVAKLYAEAG
ncbi:MAG: hypothetical protein JWR51_3856 [Devosia sp.]|uniref:hypothetical protein n=1 Tax=Devosia sp. TaxID=1871048 RepID=UPI00261ABA4D|nr:hypothetical protein [Devosia sp.]MDB5530753.1 hypothetical protein [Devosia sp.]